MQTNPKNFIQKSAMSGGNVSVVSPKIAIKILEKQHKDVEKMTFIVPKLGGNSFGKFSVKWKRGAINATR